MRPTKRHVLEVAEAYDLRLRLRSPCCRRRTLRPSTPSKATCERLNQAGEFARANNLGLHYHNHWWEFKTDNGTATLRCHAGRVGRGRGFGRLTPIGCRLAAKIAVAVVRQVGARAPLIHLKDGWLEPRGDMAAVGHGVMNVPELVDATAETADWYIVEQDRSNNDRLDAVRQSYDYLTSNGLARGKK